MTNLALEAVLTVKREVHGSIEIDIKRYARIEKVCTIGFDRGISSIFCVLRKWFELSQKFRFLGVILRRAECSRVS
jgi:hypothetical protein